jgi:hypothetical protein
MPRRRGTASVDPLADLAKKAEILEREMAAQRAALERLKELAASGEGTRPPAATARSSA